MKRVETFTPHGAPRKELMVRVNDKWDIPWREGMTMEDLLKACGFSHSYLVVSRNGRLVPPDEYASHLVSDGDQVRVVHVIGGGQ